MRRWRHIATLFLLGLCLCIGIVGGQETTATPVESAVDEEILDEVLSATGDDVKVEEPATPEEPAVEVDDYLATLSTSELRSICVDRGFDIIPRKDGLPLERNDYLEAARRCLSLEDEMNAILAKNPDLAAELEQEILRMQQHKERLEGEREQLLAEKALLQQQLEQAGVDLLEATGGGGTDTKSDSMDLPASKKSVEDMSFKEVLFESFSLLYDRVRADVMFVWKFAGPVLKPVGSALELGWRHLRPHALMAKEEVLKRGKQIIATVRSKIDEKMFNPNDDDEEEF